MDNSMGNFAERSVPGDVAKRAQNERGVALAAATFLGLAMNSPMAGWLMDRYGYKRVISLSITCLVICLLLLAIDPISTTALGIKLLLLGLLGVATSPVGIRRCVHRMTLAGGARRIVRRSRFAQLPPVNWLKPLDGKFPIER